MNAIDRRAHTWRVLLSLPGRVGMVAPVTAEDLQRMTAGPASAPRAPQPLSRVAVTTS